MANILEKIAEIRDALFGKDVRESIASGIEAINTEVESTTSKQELLETTFNQLVINEGNSNAEIVQARVDAGGNAYTNLKERMDTSDSLMAEIVQDVNLYASKQTIALGKVININIKNLPISVVCQGTSMTAGGQEGGVNPYPTILGNILNEYTGNQATVINRGNGGDTIELSYNRWTTNPNANLHILEFGHNEAWTGKTIEQSILDYFKLIKRILDWGSAVVILTPPRKRGYGTDIMSFNTMVKRLGKMLNIPVFDTAEMLEGYNLDDIYVSDYVHYNDNGYYYLACKIATLFIGSSVLKNDFFRLKGGKHISLESWRGYMRINGVADLQSKVGHTTNSPFGTGDSKDFGIQISLDQNQQLNIGFYAEEDDLVLVPIFDITGQAQCSVETNYRSTQPKQVTALSDKKNAFSEVSIPNRNLIFTKGSVQKNYSVSPYYIRLTSRGLNNIYIKNTGDASTTLHFMGFYVMGYEEFNNRKRIEEVNSAIPLMKSGVVTSTALTGSVTFSTAFPTACSVVVATCEEYQTVNDTVSYYNKTEDGFNWTVNAIGTKFNWMATGN